MKKRGVLHHELSDLIARMGHTDTLVLGDAGLPVPPGVQRIDLAISGGVPALLDVLRPLLEDLAVEFGDHRRRSSARSARRFTTRWPRSWAPSPHRKCPTPSSSA